MIASCTQRTGNAGRGGIAQWRGWVGALVLLVSACGHRQPEQAPQPRPNRAGLDAATMTVLTELRPNTVYNAQALGFDTRRKMLDTLAARGYVTISEYSGKSTTFVIAGRTPAGDALVQAENAASSGSGATSRRRQFR